MSLAAAAPALLASSGSTVPDVSVGHLLIQMVVAIGVIGGGIWLFGKFVQRRRSGLLTSGGKATMRGLSVISRTSLGKDHLVAVVAWGERELLIGVSGSTITLLADGGARAATDDLEEQDATITSMMERSLPSGTLRAGTRPSFLEALRAATLRD